VQFNLINFIRSITKNKPESAENKWKLMRISDSYFFASFQLQMTPRKKITQRQNEILRLVANGKTTSEISSLLNISVKTVETHRKNLIRKFGVSNAVQLIYLLAKEKLL